MTKLSKNMIETLFNINEKQLNTTKKVFVRSWGKNSWESTGSAEGMSAKTLNALETRGLIVITKEARTMGGQFNPVADSWGYSTYVSTWYAEMTPMGTKTLSTI